MPRRCRGHPRHQLLHPIRKLLHLLHRRRWCSHSGRDLDGRSLRIQLFELLELVYGKRVCGGSQKAKAVWQLSVRGKIQWRWRGHHTNDTATVIAPPVGSATSQTINADVCEHRRCMLSCAGTLLVRTHPFVFLASRWSSLGPIGYTGMQNHSSPEHARPDYVALPNVGWNSRVDQNMHSSFHLSLIHI